MEPVQDSVLVFICESSQPVPQISLGEEFALPQPSQELTSEPKIQIFQHTPKIESPSGNTESQGILNIQKRKFRCTECDKYSCETDEKLLMHIRKVHRNENPYQCYMCDYSTYNKTLFEEHCRIHQGIKPFKCSKCPYRSASKKNTKKHELLHRPDNPRRCNLCEFIGRNKHSLLKHKLEEHGIDLRCGHCNLIAATEEELKTHLLTHQGGHLTCKRCGSKYSNKIKLRKHNSARRKCHICDEMLCTRRFLRRHLVAVHGLELETEVTAKEPMFKCAICDWSSRIATKILLHLIHHPNQVVDETVIDVSVLRSNGIMV